MFCSNCGKEVRNDVKFCSECGAKFNTEDALTIKNQEVVNFNNETNIKKIIEYFKKIIELETRKYALNKLIIDLSSKKIKETEYRSEKNEYKNVGWFKLVLRGIRVAISCIPSIALFSFLGFTVIWSLFKEFFEKNDYIENTFIKLWLIGTFIVLIKNSIDYIKDDYKDKIEEQQYNEEVKVYNAKAEEYNSTIDSQKMELKEKINIANNQMKETKELLGKLYDLNVVHKKYQNFVAITTMCEYFETGRCNSFDGYTGAYNIYEQETRQDIIISKLEDILYSLEDIKKNQFVMYCAIQNGNNLASQLISSNNDLNIKTEELRQNSEFIKQNTEILTYIELFN